MGVRQLAAAFLLTSICSASMSAQADPLIRSVYFQSGVGQAKLTEEELEGSHLTIAPVRSVSLGLGVESRSLQRIAVVLEGHADFRGALFRERGGRDVRLRTSHRQLAALGRYQLVSVSGFQLRPQAGVEFSSLAQHDFVDEQTGTVLGLADSKHTELAALLGARIHNERYPRWSLDFRYKIGLTPTSEEADYRNRSWLVQVGFAFIHRRSP